MLQNKDGKNISFSSVKVIVTSSFSFGNAVNHWEKKVQLNALNNKNNSKEEFIQPQMAGWTYYWICFNRPQ